MITSLVFSHEAQSRYRRVKELCHRMVEKYGKEVTYVSFTMDEVKEVINALEEYIKALPEDIRKDVAICLPGDLPERCVPHEELVNKVKTSLDYLKSVIKYFGNV